MAYDSAACSGSRIDFKRAARSTSLSHREIEDELAACTDNGA